MSLLYILDTCHLSVIWYKISFKVLSDSHILIYHGLEVFLNIQILVIIELNGAISILLFT